jgi:hypothetical protein
MRTIGEISFNVNIGLVVSTTDTILLIVQVFPLSSTAVYIIG